MLIDKKVVILSAETLATRAIDTPQRDYAVFKVRARCVDELQHTL
ncbi:MAG: hypothetical protein V7K39_16230 [Nostoc sp.]